MKLWYFLMALLLIDYLVRAVRLYQLAKVVYHEKEDATDLYVRMRDCGYFKLELGLFRKSSYLAPLTFICWLIGL